MEQITITATKRDALGKKAKTLKSSGQLPAVLYGHNVENQSIEINEKEFAKAFKQAGESTVVNLVVDGQAVPVLIHEVQNHYLNDNPIHVDFYAINMKEKVKVNVPIHFSGEAMAVKALGGTLVKNLSEVEVEALPGNLPHAIEVSIESLKTFDDAIRLSDLKVGEGVEIQGNPEELVVNVVPPRSEEEMKALDEAVTEDVTAVEGVVKPEAEAAEGGEADAGKKEPEAKKE